ncbi:MAG: hypothetical protein ABJM36_06100 [Algibacter sp.]|uniref:hypothetical protein n=1 Tax=Algibacter sp. TaxID=1872428 RepID=UPI0032986847
MKKVIYYLLIVGIAFTGCNPLEDITDEINSRETAGVDYAVGAAEYTFTDEDYELYEQELDSVGYFSSQDLADQIIPDFLAAQNPVWGEGSLVNVTYNLYAETVLESMSTTDVLSNIYEIRDYLSANYETAANGTFVELSYTADILSYTLSDDDFETIGNALSGTYPEATSSAIAFGNFERRGSNSAYWSDGMILEGFNVLFGDDYTVGQVVAVTFAIYDGGTNWSESFTVQYNGSGFLKLDVDAAGGTSIDYTLSDDEYDTIAAELLEDYPAPAANLAQYGSFTTDSNSSNYWSEAMILEGLNLVLPTATEGDVYAVTYAIYNGSTVTTETLTLQYTSGAYVINATTVDVTAIVAKNGLYWVFPYTVTDADYNLLGQSYGNFDSGSIFRLDIFLESLFPYAQAGDETNVVYEYYDGSTNTKYGTSVFDGNKWKLTPDIIETSFQYGYEDGEWVPDNTISYGLVSADITFISNTFIDIYPGPADNVGFFGSFDRRDTSSNYWSDDMLLEAFNALLDSINADAAEGQKYALSFVIYNGATVTETQYVIKTDGEWVFQE